MVVSAKRAYALDVLQSIALHEERQGMHIDSTTQSTTCQGQRRSAMKQVGLINEVGRNDTEIDGSKHGRVNLHPIPEHLCVTGRSASEFCCRLGRPSVTLDEEC